MAHPGANVGKVVMYCTDGTQEPVSLIRFADGSLGVSRGMKPLGVWIEADTDRCLEFFAQECGLLGNPSEPVVILKVGKPQGLPAVLGPAA